MEKQHNKIHRDLARKLRKDMTEPEQRLWAVLRKRQLNGCRFRRQTPLRFRNHEILHYLEIVTQQIRQSLHCQP